VLLLDEPLSNLDAKLRVQMRTEVSRIQQRLGTTTVGVLVKGLIGTAVAFVIGMGTIYAVEKSIGNSLSCGLWAECPTGATPGIHRLGGGGDGTGAGSTIGGGRVSQSRSLDRDGGIIGSDQQQRRPLWQQNSVEQQEDRREHDGQHEPGQRVERAADALLAQRLLRLVERVGGLAVGERRVREDERDLEDLLDAMQPGWRDVLVKRQFMPRIEAAGALPTVKDGGFAGRPGPEVPGIANLYLAGDWVGPEGFLVDASIATAHRAAQMVSQYVTSSQGKVVAGSVR
jgi:hypothetical protein